MREEKEFYTVAEIAELYGVTRRTVYDWIEKGLPVSRRREIGKKEHAVITCDDVDDFIRPGIVETSKKMN